MTRPNGFFLFIILFPLLFFPAAVSAFEEVQPREWAFLDEGDQDGPSAWNIQENGAFLLQTANIYGGENDGARPDKPGTMAIAGKADWSDYDLTASLCSDDDDALGVVFRFRDPDNYYRLSMDRSRSYRRLVKKTKGRFTVLAEDRFVYQPKRWYRVAVKVRQNRIQIYMDDAPVFDLRDSDHKSGQIGMYCWGNAGSLFRNIQLNIIARAAADTARGDAPEPLSGSKTEARNPERRPGDFGKTAEGSGFSANASEDSFPDESGETAPSAGESGDVPQLPPLEAQRDGSTTLANTGGLGALPDPADRNAAGESTASMDRVMDRYRHHLRSLETAGPDPSLPSPGDARVREDRAAQTPAPSLDGRQNGGAPDAAPNAPKANETIGDDYIIGPGDLLLLSVWKEEALTRQVVVLPDGRVSFPLIGQLVADGKNVSALREELERRLDRFIPDPVVSVSVQQVASMQVFVIGKANRPGQFNLNAHTTVMQALAMAGGLNVFAKSEKIRILRASGGTTEILNFNYDEVAEGENLAQNIFLKRGDVIMVP